MTDVTATTPTPTRGAPMAPQAKAVLAFVQRNPGCTVQQVHTGALPAEPLHRVRKIVNNLQQLGHVHGNGKCPSAYSAGPAPKRAPSQHHPKPPRTAGLTTPNNGPGYTPNKWAEGRLMADADRAAQKTHTNTTAQRGDYIPRELAPFEGRPGAMDAFNLPSVVNGRRIEPRRIKAMCVGPAGSAYSAAGGVARKFAA